MVSIVVRIADYDSLNVLVILRIECFDLTIVLVILLCSCDRYCVWAGNRLSIRANAIWE